MIGFFEKLRFIFECTCWAFWPTSNESTLLIIDLAQRMNPRDLRIAAEYLTTIAELDDHNGRTRETS